MSRSHPKGSAILSIVRNRPHELANTSRSASELVERATDSAGRLRPFVDQRVFGIRGPSGWPWVSACLGVLEAGGSPLLLGDAAPDAEATRLARLAGAAGWIDLPSWTMHRLEGWQRTGSQQVLMTTSGTTGAAKVVGRSERSLLDEADRYLNALEIRADDHVTLPLPLHHAYALGWLVSALAAGAELEFVAPWGIAAAIESIVDRATMVALVPSTARLLLQRARRSACLNARRLRMAMVGAGAVDLELDNTFRAVFGVGLSRNYGSTETGAVFCGRSQLPTGCVGRAMQGVHYRVVDDGAREAPPGSVGLLEVRTERGFHPMGDLVRDDPDHGLTILGRQSSAIRRGDRWVAPLEIEQVMLRAPGVADAAVRRVDFGGRDSRVVVDVVPAARATFDLAAVMAHARAELSAYKVPDDVCVRAMIRRYASGKSRESTVLRSAAAIPSREASPRGELARALESAGVLDLLDGAHDVDDIAQKLDLHTAALARLVDAAVAAGFVLDVREAEPTYDRSGGRSGGPWSWDAAAIGRALSRKWLPRVGQAADIEQVGPVLDELGIARTELHVVADATDLTTIALGTANVVLASAIHGPLPLDDLRWLASLLAPGGALVIDDIFAPASIDGWPAAVLVAVERGTSWVTLDELIAGLIMADLDVIYRKQIGPRVIVVASAPA